MKFTVASGPFKESLTAREAAETMALGIRRVPQARSAEIVSIPMADGGEGTVAAMVEATGGRFVTATVTGPLGTPVQATFGVLGDGKTAVIEMASASGLMLVPHEQRDPLLTTTRGTGELIRAALDLGVQHIIIGIGGSATVDGGCGMAAALGVRLLDRKGKPIGLGGGAIYRLAHIDISDRDPRLAAVRLDVACDVDNPLLGQQGAARVYGPQKGATPETVEILEGNLKHLAALIRRDLGVDVADQPGAGAAGGLGAGLVAFLGARLRRGIDIVAEALRLEERLQGSDLVLTGEGRLDEQSIHGKVVSGVARAAHSRDIPVIVLAGALGEGCERILSHGVTAYFAIIPTPGTLADTMRKARDNLQRTAEQAVRAFLAGRRA